MNNLTCDRMKGILKGADQGKPQIMIVDDQESVRRLLSRMLKMKGDECTLAADAKEARTFLKDQKFDLILCDVSMPGESGIDFIRYVLSKYPETATIMITAVDDPEVAESALEIGAYGYIIKPFEPNEVMINVSNALRRCLEIIRIHRRLRPACLTHKMESNIPFLNYHRQFLFFK